MVITKINRPAALIGIIKMYFYLILTTDLKSDKKQYGGTSCANWNVGIIVGKSLGEIE